MPVADRWIHLPGLGTGVRSTKGAELARRLSARGIRLDTVDLRVPDFPGMRLPSMLGAARAALGPPGTRAVVFGTSLGGHLAVRLAREDRRVVALVLFSPALDLAAIREAHPWPCRMWRTAGWIPWWDKTERRHRPLGAALLADLIDARTPPPVAVPTLVVHGLRDTLVPVAGSRSWVSGDARVRLLEVDAGHDLAAALPEVMTEVEDFLDPWLASGTATLRSGG